MYIDGFHIRLHCQSQNYMILENPNQTYWNDTPVLTEKWKGIRVTRKVNITQHS